MGDEGSCFGQLALREAGAYLRRWGDGFTRAWRDDVAQESAIAALQLLPRLRKPCAFRALVRTIARRMRARALRYQARTAPAVADASDAGPLAVAEAMLAQDQQPLFLVAGRYVPRDWLLASLTIALPKVGPTNRCLLLGYYEGFSCGELGERIGMDPILVKVRLHRTRGALRKTIERMVRAADTFEVGSQS